MVHFVSPIDLCSAIQRSIPLQLNLKRNYSFLEGIMLKYNNQMGLVVRLLGLSSVADTVTCYLTINKISFILVFQFNFHCCDKCHEQKQLPRKGFIFIVHVHSTVHHLWSLGQEFKQKPTQEMK